jgi:fructose-6-phosphate aldolase 2
VVTEIVEEFKLHDIKAKVLAASFKNAEQVHKCALAGCHSATVTADIMKTLISHPMTDAAIEGFVNDWRNVYGDRKISDFN